MIEPGDPTKTTRTVTHGDIPCSAWRHPLALATAAAVGAVAFAIFRVLVPSAAGDEPPIRVRNGSLELRLDVREKWKTSGTNWKITGAKRNNDEYLVFVTFNSGTPCTGNGSATGSSIEITYFVAAGNTKSVKLTVDGKHTLVDSDAPLQISTDKKVLSYSPGTGYIQSISVGGKPFCTFTDQTQLANMYIEDF